MSPTDLTSVSTTLRRIWSELLELPDAEVHATANFFALGGTSVHLLSLQVLIAQQLDVLVTTAELHEHLQFADLCCWLQQRSSEAVVQDGTQP